MDTLGYESVRRKRRSPWVLLVVAVLLAGAGWHWREPTWFLAQRAYSDWQSRRAYAELVELTGRKDWAVGDLLARKKVDAAARRLLTWTDSHPQLGDVVGIEWSKRGEPESVRIKQADDGKFGGRLFCPTFSETVRTQCDEAIRLVAEISRRQLERHAAAMEMKEQSSRRRKRSLEQQAKDDWSEREWP